MTKQHGAGGEVRRSPTGESSGPGAASEPALKSANTDVSTVAEAAVSGDLVIDEEAATRILRTLSSVREQVDDVLRKTAKVDVRMELGNNQVAAVMDLRLHTAAGQSPGFAASGQNEAGAVIPNLLAFQGILNDFEYLVRESILGAQQVDEESAQAMRRLAGVVEATLSEANGQKASGDGP